MGYPPFSAQARARWRRCIALSAEFKADLRGVAIVQVMRVLLVTIGLPGGLALFGLGGRLGDRRAAQPRRRLVARWSSSFCRGFGCDLRVA